ncbi:protein phosphatase 2C domain-containing protein [Streptomyces sp. NBC_01451]|uniref:protein phosphatase 2C domain-containing protein n=1 Tax=Streptomyces sp. NBC_01451 TaxID=2903872 RepID=UPI002E2FE6CA|nr:protein phosphatase 2C domain-containing protein [Streptomyces sp. NBC_01451]
MSQQGERSTGHEDDWWGQLYDDSTEDTGPTAAGDSLDDRFASASGTVDAAKADAHPERDGRGAVFGREPVAGDAFGTSGAFEEWYETAPPASPAPPVSSPAPAFPPVSALPPQRGGEPRGAWDAARNSGPGQPRAPWEPPPAMPRSPASFPPGPKPPGFQDRTGPSAPGAAFADGAAGPPGGSAQETGADMTEATDAVWDAPPRPPAATDPVSASAPVSAREDTPDRPPSGSPPHHSDPRDDIPADPAQDGSPADFSVLRAPVLRTPTRRDVPALPSEAPRAQGAPASPATPGSSSSALAVDGPPATVGHVGSGPPTYAPEPTALPPADPDDLGDLVADTVLDGAHYGVCALRAVSLRGDSARFRGEPRRDSLLTARFGAGDNALVLIAMATGARATPGAHRAAAEACQWIGRAVGRSHARLAEDLRAARRGDLKSGLQRLTDRSLGRLRASAAEQGIEPEEYTAGLRCLLLPADPDCRTRVFFGVGAGGLFRLRDGEWQDIEPRVADIPAGEPVVGFGSPPHETPDGDRLTMDLGITTPPSPYEPAPEPRREPFRFRASVARPGDTLLLCTGGLAEPLRGEPELCEYLTGRWSGGTPPGLAAFLADTQVRVKGYADDRTAAAVWDM